MTSKVISTKATFYHGSKAEMPVGAVMTGRGDAYVDDWRDTDFYPVLEQHRPEGMLAHKDSVFMCDNSDDIDSAAGGAEFVFELQTEGPIERHDLNWSHAISFLLSKNHAPDSAAIKEAARNYWTGVPCGTENLWEYLTPKATILRVGAPLDEPFAT